MAAKRVLMTDDEPRMRKLVADFLKRENLLVEEAANGREALERMQSRPAVDLVILDVMMPEMDGWAACREIRRLAAVPIILLTARDQESDELFGFDLGADEYIAKPFSPQILVARVKALLRRVSGREPVLEFDSLDIDTAGRRVTLAGQAVELSPTEYDLLQYLATNRGQALSREQILNAVWGYDYFGETRTVDTHITRLRSKLRDCGELIQTVRGVGYRFGVKA